MQLDAIASNERQALREFCLQRDADCCSSSLRVSSMTSRIASLMSNRSCRGGAFLMRARIRPMTSLARLPSLTIRSSACRTSSRSRRLGAKPAQSGVGVGDRRGDRLVDLMGDRGRQLPHGRDAIGVRELHLRLAVSPLALAQVLLRLLALGQIEHEGDALVSAFAEGRRAEQARARGCRLCGSTPSRKACSFRSP